MHQILKAHLTQKKKIHVSDKHDNNLLYFQFVVWSCNSCGGALLTDYANNEVFHKLPTLKDYFTNSGEKLSKDLRRSKGYTDELEKLTRNNGI